MIAEGGCVLIDRKMLETWGLLGAVFCCSKQRLYDLKELVHRSLALHTPLIDDISYV